MKKSHSFLLKGSMLIIFILILLTYSADKLGINKSFLPEQTIESDQSEQLATKTKKPKHFGPTITDTGLKILELEPQINIAIERIFEETPYILPSSVHRYLYADTTKYNIEPEQIINRHDISLLELSILVTTQADIKYHEINH